MHLAETSRLFQWCEEGTQGKFLVAGLRIGVFRSGSGDGQHHAFAGQPVTVSAIGETVLQYQILPFLDERWRGIPEQRKLEQNDIMVQQALLLYRDVDVVARIIRIQIYKGDAIHIPRDVCHFPICLGMALPGMGIIHDQSCQNSPLCLLSSKGERGRRSKQNLIGPVGTQQDSQRLYVQSGKTKRIFSICKRFIDDGQRMIQFVPL